MDGKSPHILNASSNLLGFSFVVLTSIKGFGLMQTGYVDESIGLCVVAFAVSCLMSFLSIRTSNEKRSKRFETIADYIFLTGASVLTIASVLLTLNILTFK